MHTFRDANGHDWNVDLTIGSIRRIRAMTGIDLLDLIKIEKNTPPDTAILDRLTDEADTLADVLFAACKDEADRLGITNIVFCDAFNGRMIESAQTALFEEILDFFPEAKRSRAAKTIRAKRRFATMMMQCLGEAAVKEIERWNASLLRSPGD